LSGPTQKIVLAGIDINVDLGVALLAIADRETGCAPVRSAAMEIIYPPSAAGLKPRSASAFFRRASTWLASSLFSTNSVWKAAPAGIFP